MDLPYSNSDSCSLISPSFLIDLGITCYNKYRLFSLHLTEHLHFSFPLHLTEHLQPSEVNLYKQV